MKLILEHLKGNYRQAVLGPLFKLLEAIFELCVPLVIANIIDIGIAGGDKRYIVQRGIILVLLALAGVICGLICQYFAAVAAGQFGRRIRGHLYRHILGLSQAEVDRIGSAKLITLVTNDTNQMLYGLNLAIRLGSRVPFLALGSIIMALLLNWKIGLIFLVTAPLVAAVLYLIMRRTLPYYAQIQGKQDQLSRLGQETLKGARVIRAFHREESEQVQFEQASQELNGQLIAAGRLSSLLNPITSLLTNLAIALIVWLGAGLSFQGLSNAGEIIALVSYMNSTVLALIVAVNLIVAFTRALASAKRVTEALETKASIVDGEGAELSHDAPLLQCSDVSFSYLDGVANAVEGISFALEAGKTIGIIGGTGSGKSTLAQLILRFFDPQQGEIFFSGSNLRCFQLSQLRSYIGYVPQKAALFTGSIRRNLHISAPQADDETLWWALRVAQAEEFVQKLPDGLDSMIEEGGKNLSGGQRQRLTIARALARRPRLLVLDDAASALDYATDAALRRALATETGDMAVVLISQRAAGMQSAHEILVLDGGRIAARGTHQSLLRESDIYQEICQSQGLLEGGTAS